MSISCVSTIESNKRPDWVIHSSQDGMVCGVGSSLPHIKGKSFQRSTATMRALEQIAVQKRVRIDSELKLTTVGDSNYSKSKINLYSVHTIEGINISGLIRGLWFDKVNGELFVLVCTSD